MLSYLPMKKRAGRKNASSPSATALTAGTQKTSALNSGTSITHGFIPANHTYVIRGDVYREHPWVALNLFNAFVKSKDASVQSLNRRMPTNLVFGREYMEQTREVFGSDPYPYGVKANEQMLTTLIEYSHEQGLTKNKAKIEEMFAPITLNL